MVWPTTLTDNASVLRHVYVQGLTRILESGNDFNALHEGVAQEVRLWLENAGTPDADDITNASDFSPAATHLFVAKVLRDSRPDLAEEYNRKFLAIMSTTRPQVGGDSAGSGGTLGRVVVIKQGPSFYTRGRTNPLFKPYRKSP